jgi:hypothetical protein
MGVRECGMDLTVLREDAVADSCEYYNEPSGTTNWTIIFYVGAFHRNLPHIQFNSIQFIYVQNLTATGQLQS